MNYAMCVFIPFLYICMKHTRGTIVLLFGVNRYIMV